MGDFTMPSLGADMDAGSVLEWCVAPGDRVHRGDVVAVIHTDKNDIDAEAFEDGRIGELLVEPGVEVPVGTPLVAEVAEGAEVAEVEVAEVAEVEVAEVEVAEVEVAEVEVAEVEPAPPARTPTPAPTPDEPPTYSPIVRRLVREEHLDPAALHGTGPGGSLRRGDVEAAATHPGPAPRVDRPIGRISPRARRLARELGVDPALVRAAREGAAVTGADVLALTAQPQPPTAEPPGSGTTPSEPGGTSAARATTTPPGSERGGDERALAMRRRIATLMERSKREIPHYHLIRQIDLTPALTWLERWNEDRPARERMIPAALLLTATARAAAEIPGFNGTWRDGAYQPAERVDLGIIVNLRGGGLLVPVIADAASLSAPELMDRLHGAVSRARKGRLRSSELGEGSITVSELGDGGADAVFGVIHPPQVALVGFGRPREAPWVEGGMLGVRTVVDTTLAADHRVSDGHAGSRFLLALDTALHDPASLEGEPPRG